MSAVMLAAQRAGLMGEQPPEKIVRSALDEAGAREDVTEDEEHLLSSVAHLAFGASMGALFGLLHHQGSRRLPPTATGTAFGLAVWAAAYEGLIPRLGIMPAPEHDRAGRPTSMVVSHLVWGATMGLVVSELAAPDGTAPA